MTRSPNRLLATVFGTVYVLVGIAGWFVTTGVPFFATDNSSLLVWLFMVNPFHNTAHLLIGALLLVAGLSTVPAAKTANTAVGVVYLLLGIVGLFVQGTAFNILALNAADHVLHFASAIVLLAVGLGADRVHRGATATPAA